MRLSLGGFSTVVMTDKWHEELRAGRAFVCHSSIAGVAGQYSHVQLMNPAGSGVQAIVAEIRITRPVAGTVEVCFYNVALAVDGGAIPNLLSGVAAGGCHIRRENNVAQLGTFIDFRDLAAGVPTILWPSWAPELSPGMGVLVRTTDVNQALRATFLVNEV